MNDFFEALAGILVFILLAAPVVGFVLFMRYMKRKEQAVLLKYGLVED